MEIETSSLYDFLEGVTLVLICLGSIGLWVRWFLSRSESRRPLLESRPRVQSPVGIVDVLVMLFLFLAGQVLAVFIVGQISGFDLDFENPGTLQLLMLVGSLLQLIAVFAGVGFVWFRYRAGGVAVTSLQPGYVDVDLKIGLLAFVMVIPFVMGLQWVLTLLIPYEHPTLELLANDKSLFTIGATWFAAALVAPITEEIFFRGMLQNWLQRLGPKGLVPIDSQVASTVGGFARLDLNDALSGSCQSATNSELGEERFPNQTPGNHDLSNPYESPTVPAIEGSTTGSSLGAAYQPKMVQEDSPGFWLPITISSVFFALVHSGQGPAPISLFCFSLALGYLYRRTNSIIPCIVLHFSLNAFSMFWFTLAQFMPA